MHDGIMNAAISYANYAVGYAVRMSGLTPYLAARHYINATLMLEASHRYAVALKDPMFHHWIVECRFALDEIFVSALTEDR